MGSWYTPADIARERKLRVSKVLTWIRTGELLAVNMAEKRAGRPRWRIPARMGSPIEMSTSNPNGEKAISTSKPAWPSTVKRDRAVNADAPPQYESR